MAGGISGAADPIQTNKKTATIFEKTLAATAVAAASKTGYVDM